MKISGLFCDFQRIYGQINEEVANGDDPKIIGRLVHRIIQKKKPKLRYKAANFLALLAIASKRTLRYRWYEKLMMNHYKMNLCV